MATPTKLDITKKQLQVAHQYTSGIINDLPDRAIIEMLGGYDEDIESLLMNMYSEVSDVMCLNRSLDTERLEYLDNLEISMDKTLKKLSYNYFKTTVLHGFRQEWRNLEFGNLIQLYPNLCIIAQRGSGKSFEFCYALPLWRLYSYDRPNDFYNDTIDNKNRKETLIVSNVETLAKEHTEKIIEEIKFNDILSDKLNPNGKADLGTKRISTETGSILHIRGAFGFARGLHVGFVIEDDLPDESSLYSIEQRLKIKEKVYGTFTPIVEPFGSQIISGTRYHDDDIYGTLKKDPMFKVFEYPAVMPDGKLLSPDRFTFEKLNDIRNSIGSIVFTREYLCVPMSNDTSIFPREFLERSIIGMENVKFANSIHEYPFKMKQKVLVCDFAISGKIGSDYSVFGVWGIDFDGNFHLISIWRKQSSSFEEQVNQIISMDARFKPNEIVCETNGFQRIMADMVKKRGLKNVKEFVTIASKKKDSYEGLPALSAIFERGEIKIPYADGETRNMTETIFGEFNSISFREDKGTLEGTGSHDDIPMMSFIGIYTLREKSGKTFKAYSV